MRTYRLRRDCKFDRFEAKRMYESGMSTVQIGKIFGVDKSNIFHGLKRVGVNLRNKSESRNLAFATGRAKIKHGKDVHTWKGGRTVHSCGYILVKENGHHRANAGGYVPEQILVMEKAIGRPVKDGEVVHHINGDKKDNRPENLLLFKSESDHLKHHASMTNGYIGCNLKRFKKQKPKEAQKGEEKS